MQDNNTDSGLLVPDVLSDLVILAEATVQRFVKQKISQSKTASVHTSFERILNVDVTAKIINATESEFDMDLQVFITLPLFINLDEHKLAEESADYALAEVEKKFIELKESSYRGIDRDPKTT